MPKATPSQATEGSFGIQEGLIRVEDATFRTYQMSQNKKTGATYAAFPALILTLKRLGDDGETEGEPDEQPFGCGKLDKFAPTDDKNLNTPADDYADAETEGRYIMALNGGTNFNKAAKFIRLNDSLIANGFRSDLIDECDAKVYIGLEGVIKQDTQRGSDGKDYRVTVFDKITKFPYDVKGGKAPAKKKAAADDDDGDEAPAKKSKSKFDPEAAAESLLKKLVKVWKKKGTDSVDLASVRKAANLELMDSDPDERDEVISQLRDTAWLKTLDIGFSVKKDGTLVLADE